MVATIEVIWIKKENKRRDQGFFPHDTVEHSNYSEKTDVFSYRNLIHVMERVK